MNFLKLTPLSTARDILRSLIAPHISTITIPLTQSIGFYAADNMKALGALPTHARSLVDGYAVRSKDVAGASEFSPAYIPLQGEILIGTIPPPLLPGKAMYIPTGGILPEGADTVIMVEYTGRDITDNIEITTNVARGEHILFPGDDLSQGETILAKGTRISLSEILSLSACGIATIPVFKPLTFGIISSGNELVPAGSSLKPGTIYDVNSPSLFSIITLTGEHALPPVLLPDDTQQLQKAIIDLLDTCDIILLSGGSSAGEHDLTLKLLSSIENCTIHFHGLATKPGKPTILASLGTIPVIGLPGHPIAALMVFFTLIRETMAQLRSTKIPGTGAILNRGFSTHPGKTTFQSVTLSNENGTIKATPLFGTSNSLSLLSKACGYISIDDQMEGIAKNTLVDVIPFIF